MIEIKTPAEQFFDTDGKALDGGYIYVGVTGSNPETSPQAIYWDKDGLIPAANPVRTVNGYPSRSGAPSKFYTSTKTYSITVKNARGVVVQTTLNTDSGVFDELSSTTGAASVGYDNSTSGMTATTVQEGLDELKATEGVYTTLIDDLTKQFTGINIFPNSAFLDNENEYVTGTATSGANEETLDDVFVITPGQSLAFEASATFGNKITAPAGGAYVTIPSERITGGEYACTWVGSGTIEVNGTARVKDASFTLTANTDAVVTMYGEIEQFQFTRPYSLGAFEYKPDLLKFYGTKNEPKYNNNTEFVPLLGLDVAPVSLSGTSMDFTGVPAWTKSGIANLDGYSLSGSSRVLIQIGTASGIVATGYAGGRFFSSSGGTSEASATNGLASAISTASIITNLRVTFDLMNATTNRWMLTADGTATSGAKVSASATITLTDLLTQVRIRSENGTDTFDAGSISFKWRP